MTEKKNEWQVRQGDVFLIKIDEIPSTAIKQEKEDRIVLEHGEVTGHAHAIKEIEKVDLYLEGTKKYLEVCFAVDLGHEEHTAIRIPEGKYEVRRQITWSALEEMGRLVQD